MLRWMRQIPFFKLLAIAQMLLLARRHLRGLTAADRHRLAELARHGRHLTPAERDELRRLVSKLEPRAFAYAAANRVSPLPLPRRLAGRRAR
jgi:hypothetical protein